MKKFTTKIITKDNKEKTIKVYLDDNTVKLLEQTNDKKLIKEYILEEYKARLIERKETRRHLSLDNPKTDILCSLNKSFEVEEKIIDSVQLHSALKKLLAEQRELIADYYFKDRTLQEIANEKGVSPQAVAQQLKRAINRLKNIFKNF